MQQLRAAQHTAAQVRPTGDGPQSLDDIPYSAESKPECCRYRCRPRHKTDGTRGSLGSTGGADDAPVLVGEGDEAGEAAPLLEFRGRRCVCSVVLMIQSLWPSMANSAASSAAAEAAGYLLDLNDGSFGRPSLPGIQSL